MRVVLPSQRVVEVSVDLGARAPKSDRRELFADFRALASSDRFVVTEGKTRLDAATIDRLSLRDFHVLRDVAIRAHALPSEPETFPCDNCDAPLRFDGASLPLDDLEDRYEDEETAAEIEVALPDGHRVRMKPVTVADARPLWRQLGKDRPFQITPKLLASMGVVRMTPDVGDLRRIAQILEAASDDAWSMIEETFLGLAYPPRGIASITCSRCDTVHDMEVPWPRELAPGQYREGRDESATFPSERDFAARAQIIADATFPKMRAGGLELRIETGVAEVDSGGIPMLGSYAPEPRDDGGTDFVVRIYYRTFERAFRDDATFDWEHELDETIEHEAQHHLYYLSGHDPMDAEERAETERDVVRRVGGEKRYRKLQKRELFASMWEIVRVLALALTLAVIAGLALSRCAL